jgi:hypothetical protein
MNSVEEIGPLMQHGIPIDKGMTAPFAGYPSPLPKYLQALNCLSTILSNCLTL